jgi:chromosome segregation ATPase
MLQQAKANAAVETEKVKTKLELTAGELKHTHTTKRELEEKVTELSARLASFSAQAEAASRQTQELTAQLADARAQAAIDRQQHSSDLHAALQQLALEQQKHEAEVRRLSAEKGVVMATNVELEKLTKDLEDVVTNLKEVNSALSVELTTMKTHVGASNGNNLAELCSVTVEVERLRKKLEAKENAEAELLDARKAMEDMKKRLVLAESARRKLHNTVQELRGNIRVVVRVRPSLPSDLSPGDDVSPNYMPLDCQASAVKLTMNSGGENPQPLSYSFDAFDRVFAHSTEVMHVHRSYIPGCLRNS